MKRRSEKRQWRELRAANLRIDEKGREIVLDGEISMETAHGFADALYKMQDESLAPIKIRIGRSHGGCAIASMMVFAMLRHCFATTIGIVEKYARSGAFTIFQGTSFRIMRAKARITPHWATCMFEGEKWYDIAQIGVLMKYTARMNRGQYRAVCERTGLSMAETKKFFRQTRGVFSLDAKEALKWKLIDEVER
jgi:ATP-dependent protease ClpP protease subunit